VVGEGGDAGGGKGAGWEGGLVRVGVGAGGGSGVDSGRQDRREKSTLAVAILKPRAII